MELYNYQKNVLECIANDPTRSQLISMPTGTGKTITFLSAIKEQNKTCLVLVHRQELLHQTMEKAKLIGFKEEDISVISSEEKGEIRRLTIAMVPTLNRNLEKYNAEAIEMMVIDEAHHASAASYQKIIEYFKIKEDKKLLLGFTATPLRGDKKQLSQTFESHSFKMTLSEATQNGYICPVHGIRVDIDKSLAEIDQVQGDYDIRQLEHVMNCDQINNLIAEKCENLHKSPVIIFCTSINHAQEVARKIREKKRKAISISYKTTPRTLNQILKMFKEKRIEFITNVTKLSEGFDHPALETVILARPTRSPVLYKQMIGRGLRKSPDKHDCLVIEFSGNDEKMICWEDIDENCTFQSSTLEEKKTRQQALDFYKGLFSSSDVIIKDVRVSPFKFYECFVIRKGNFKNDYIFVPFEKGFTIFKLINAKKSKSDYGWMGKDIYGWMCFWIKKYESFYIWSHGEMWKGINGLQKEEIDSRITFFCQANNQGCWYPSEEEPITIFQRKFFKDDPKISARKAQMMIEEKFIKKAIHKYWIQDKISLNTPMKIDLLKEDF